MFEPPDAASLTVAVMSNGVPAVGFAGDVVTLLTTGGCTSVSVAVKIANVSFAPVTLSTARASSCCGPAARRAQRSWTMPSPPLIAAPANTLPPPETTTKLTICPLTGRPRESSTRATSGSGNSVPGGADWLLPDTSDRESGPTGWSVSTTVLHEASTSSPVIRASEERRMGPPAGRRSSSNGEQRYDQATREDLSPQVRRSGCSLHRSQRLIQKLVDRRHPSLERRHMPRARHQHELLRLAEQIPE